MKRTLHFVMVILSAAILLVGLSAQAKKGSSSSYKRCIKGCNLAKEQLLKACEKADTAKARKKCRTLGTKKLQEECVMRCKRREK